MKISFSKKMNSFNDSIFNVLNKKIAEYSKSGKPIYNFSIGTPDFKPAKHIMEVLSEEAKYPDNYKYAITDREELLSAAKNWYKRRYNVSLDLSEIMSVYGSQEAISRIFYTLCDSGDIVLVPNPGYPIFSVGPDLCGAKVEYYNLYKENNFMLDFNDIPEDVAKKAKVIVVSYPLNPVCTLATDEFYINLIEFAKKYNIVVIHDNAYSDIVYDGKIGKSFLSFDGAKEVGVEVNSLSKAYNMTGARISFVLGNKEIVEKFKILRSQVDYGIFLPIQKAAIAALNGPQDEVLKNRIEYQARRDALCDGLKNIGFDIERSQGTMFAWSKIPSKYKSSEEFTLDLLDKTGVAVVPGSTFGSLGEGFVRLALVISVEKIKEAVKVIEENL
ncbi:MAG: aminotransferase class I/II-fold pyridoxal phosphate-dependent enzyme [Fusobacteriaceae bacterium]|jgi:LL-diaminopimelate aminotransferase|nr:aminotransferase class I/II-fold pyridoxal phosphate-dependent enzyme [Fusobacteriaceae bacterium]